MKALYLSAKEKRVAAIAANSEFERLRDDWSKRIQYLWVIAMLNAGLSPKTVMRTMKELDGVIKGYEEYATSGDIQGDDNLEYVLAQKGFKISPIKVRR